MSNGGVRLAPSWWRGLARTTGIILAAVLVTLVSYGAIGAPSRTRALDVKDAPYGPTMPFGLVQFFGQAALLAAGVYVGRRWLRVRL
jgi:hypothetical protein